MYITSPKNAYDALDCLSSAESVLADSASSSDLKFIACGRFNKAGSSCCSTIECFKGSCSSLMLGTQIFWSSALVSCNIASG